MLAFERLLKMVQILRGLQHKLECVYVAPACVEYFIVHETLKLSLLPRGIRMCRKQEQSNTKPIVCTSTTLKDCKLVELNQTASNYL